MITQTDVDELVAWMQMHLPRFEVCYKNESRLQQWIGWLLRPINPTYMTEYTTIMFGKVYFPSREAIEEWGPSQVYSTLRHEFVHLMDSKRFPIWFELSYLLLFPTILTMRAYWEWRGYTQTLLVEYEQTGTISSQLVEHIIDRYVSGDYGWMFPFRKRLQRRMKKTCQQIYDGVIQGPYPYCDWGATPLPLLPKGSAPPKEG